MEHAEARPNALAASHTSPVAETKPRQERIRIEQHSATGLLWFAGWLFTIGFLQLPFWKGVLALLLWPYYIGTTISALLSR